MQVKPTRNKFSLALLLLAVLSLTLFVQSCKEENPSVPSGTGDNSLEIVFSATANAKTFKLDEQYELTTEGFRYKFSLFKFYISQLRLVRDDNSELVLKNIDMIDFRTDAPHLSIKVNVPNGNYKELKFGIGVDSATNMMDPTVFGETSPLSITKGTYWGMSSQYRFFLMEGKMDTTMNDSLSEPFVVHTGTNPLYREKSYLISYDYTSATKGANNKMTFEIDIDKLLSGINFKNDHSSHTIGGNYTLAEKIANNLVASMKLK